jgi:subtilisin family serine protease
MLKRYTSECRSRCRFGPALAAVLALSLCLASRASAADASCEAFSLSAAAAGAGAGPAAGALDTPGVQPAAPPRLDPKLVQNQGVDGAIIRIPEGRQPAVMNRASGEALLVLPKLPSGKLADDFTLGAGAKIVDSFWSPVLCATIVRVRGPRDATPQDLLPRVAPPALVLPHSRYRTSAAKVRAAAPPKTQGPDPYLPFQLGLAQLGVMQARGRTDGHGVRVALLDSAPDVTHRELVRVRVLPLEGGPPAAPALHGTLMAGLIAAIENNAFGIVGVAPGADLMAIPVCTPVGDGSSDECDLYDVLRGIDEAWKQEATILNLSLAGPPDPLLQRAVTRLLELGAVVVAAAGNGGSSLPTYPAAYPGVVGVGALDPAGQPFAQGNHGPWVSLSGPGVEVLSTTPGNSFAFVNGTSLAAAQVSGELALLTSVVPDAVRMRMALLATARGTLVPASAETDSPASAEAPRAPTVCDVLKDLGQSCDASGTSQP